MKSFDLVFTPAGPAKCLYTEAIDLSALGPLEVTRASTIEFNHDRQRWEVRDVSGELRFVHASRAACLDWEQANLQPE